MSRRRCASPVPAPLEDDNILWEILLRLPPGPSSLPRASFVCKRWAAVVSDPTFLRRFFTRHRRGHFLRLLGLLHSRWDNPAVFTPLTDHRIPAWEDGHAFKLVVLCSSSPSRASAYIYASESGVWQNSASAADTTDLVSTARAGVMVGSTLCWSLHDGNVLELDLATQSLGVVDKPVDPQVVYCSSFHVLRTRGGHLGLAVLTKTSMQLWERKCRPDCVARWVRKKTIELGQLLQLGPCRDVMPVLILAYDEDSNVIFLKTDAGVFMLRLDDMQFRRTRVARADSAARLII